MAFLSKEDFVTIEKKLNKDREAANRVVILQNEVLQEEKKLLHLYRSLFREGFVEIKTYAANHHGPCKIRVLYRIVRGGRGYDYYDTGFMLGNAGPADNTMYQYLTSYGYSNSSGPVFLTHNNSLFFVCKPFDKDYYVPNCKIVKANNDYGYTFKGGNQKLEKSEFDGVSNAIAFNIWGNELYKLNKGRSPYLFRTIDADEVSLGKYKSELVRHHDSVESIIKQHLVKILTGE